MPRIIGAVGILAAAVLAGLLSPAVADDPPAKAKSDEIVLTDVDGKETRLTNVRLTTGTRRLAWLADPKGTTPDEKLGPQVVEVREPNSTTLAKGILTFVPVASVESVRYDYEKLSVYVTVKGVKQPLLGTLQYRGINTLGLAGTTDGKTASFTAGVLGKTAVKTITFPNAKPIADGAGGRTWAIQIVHPTANNPTVKAKNLKVLFTMAGGVQQLLDGLPVRNGDAVAFDAKLARFEMLANDPNTNYAAAAIEVEKTKEEKGERIIAIPLTKGDEAKPTGTLAGLIGEVEEGYKFFPLHTIKVIVPFSRKAD